MGCGGLVHFAVPFGDLLPEDRFSQLASINDVDVSMAPNPEPPQKIEPLECQTILWFTGSQGMGIHISQTEKPRSYGVPNHMIAKTT